MKYQSSRFSSLKVFVNVKVCCKLTGVHVCRSKTICPPDLPYRGHKKVFTIKLYKV